MRVYLDNCCYNRPFDDQTQTKVRVETICKLAVQLMMATGKVEYAWSFMLDVETSKNPDEQHRRAVRRWRNRATLRVPTSVAIRNRAKEIMEFGIKPQDAIHLACAEAGDCDWFLTVDRGILKKVGALGKMRVVNPVVFITEGER